MTSQTWKSSPMSIWNLWRGSLTALIIKWWMKTECVYLGRWAWAQDSGVPGLCCWCGCYGYCGHGRCPACHSLCDGVEGAGFQEGGGGAGKAVGCLGRSLLSLSLCRPPCLGRPLSPCCSPSGVWSVWLTLWLRTTDSSWGHNINPLHGAGPHQTLHTARLYWKCNVSIKALLLRCGVVELVLVHDLLL